MTTNDPTLPYQNIPPEPPIPSEQPPADVEPTHDPYAALKLPNYRRYFVGNAFATFGIQMGAVTIGWELYARTNSTVALGLIGLVTVLPVLLFALPAGHLVDWFDRRRLILITTAVLVFAYGFMAFSSHFLSHLPVAGPFHLINNPVIWLSTLMGENTTRDNQTHFTSIHVPLMFLTLFLIGCVRAINQPAKQALVPALVPNTHLSNAITWNSSLFETCNVAGPALAGFAIAALLKATGTETAAHQDTVAYASIYAFTAFCQVIQFFNFMFIRLQFKGRPREPMTVNSLLAGVRFVKSNQVILSSITLDMFAVLLGGATALLPAIATKVLNTGPIGLGFLRAAPSMGAVGMALFQAHRPPMQRAGRNLLIAVAGFGVATIVFGVSRNFWLSMVALVFTGIFDNVSVVVRQTLVQVLTPDEMRGRVSSINSMFISTSNELGEFESGMTAALAARFLGVTSGLMFAVAAGGVGTIAVVSIVAVVWPQLRRVKSLSDPLGLNS